MYIKPVLPNSLLKDFYGRQYGHIFLPTLVVPVSLYGISELYARDDRSV